MGRLSGLMYVCHDVCIVVSSGVVSLGSLAWYTVLCRSVFLSVISVIRSGTGFVVSRVGKVSSI